MADTPSVELATDFLTAGYYLVVDGQEVRPQNGVGTWATTGEALEWWEQHGKVAQAGGGVGVDHRVHVTGWDVVARMELHCSAGPDGLCRTVTDEHGNGPQPVDYCNVVDWWEAVDPEDVLHGQLRGEPPWDVAVTWTDDGPEIRQVPA
jgi:hypothetical protein